MRNTSSNDLFLQNDMTASAHEYRPFMAGHIDVKLSAEDADIRLFIFKPADYPYLWLKYLDGLQREYRRMGVSHILDIENLKNPGAYRVAMIAIMGGEVVAGLRCNGPIRKTEHVSAYTEMADGNQSYIKEYINERLVDGIAEPKGLWVDLNSSARERLTQLMGRCMIYSAALLDCRYAICTSAKKMNLVYTASGMDQLSEAGTVSFPNKDFKTTLGCFDLHKVFKQCSDDSRIYLRRDWQLIQLARVNSLSQKNVANEWMPLVLDEANPFHTKALESLLLDANYEHRSAMKSMDDEMAELLPPISPELKKESRRWVAYPWRKVAIELLGPQSFKKLRCDRNRNKITDEEQADLLGMNIGVVGLSTGHVIAHTLVMEGVCGHIKLADFDLLEVSNLNRIPASLLDINVNKAVITARRIAELDPYLTVDVYDKGLLDSNIDSFMEGLDIVIEECDSLDVKVLVREAAKKRRIPVLMATSDGGIMDVERYDTDKDLKPFHGLTEIDASELKDLSRRDKSGYALAIFEGDKITARLAASMVEIDYTVKTWSQLASDVTQGAAMVTTAVRRIGTGKPTPSSRTRMDMDQLFVEGKPPTPVHITDKQLMPEPKFGDDVKENMKLAACYAPSPGNIQPWRIYWQDNTLCFEVDRRLSVSMDVKWRGAMTAIGAACFNAEVVAAKSELAGEMRYFPDPKQPDLVATFELNESGKLDQSLAKHYDYLFSRVTNRELCERKALDEVALDALHNVCSNTHANLHVLQSDEALRDYADLSIESDRIRYLSEHLHEEMTSELSWPDKDSLEEGIDVRTFGMPHKDMNVLPLLERRDVMDELVKWDDAGKALGEYNRDRILCASAMLTITVSGQSDLDYVKGGRTLQELWLVAESYGVALQPISPIFLYANSKDDIRTLMKNEFLLKTGQMKDEFNKIFGINTTNYPVIVMRAAYCDAPNFRSYRRI
ncbi:Rv1355c family protein [Leucothrix sargassi]|nr:Rv1355c family protein [Leucothrix sargassi]